MQTSAFGREIIESFESCMKAIKGRPGIFTTYRDEVGVLTIGYGHTNLGNVPPHIVSGMLWTKEQCDDALSNDLRRFEGLVDKALGAFAATQSMYDALVSFDFNTGHLTTSTILPKLLGGDLDGAITVLLEYNHAGGKVLNGLTRRRKCEAAMMRGDLKAAAELADLHLSSDEIEETAAASVDHREIPGLPPAA